MPRGHSVPGKQGFVRKDDPTAPTGGRRKGIPNKRTQMIYDKLEELGCDPLALLVAFATNDRATLRINQNAPVPIELRYQATKELMTYVYAKQRSIKVDVGDATHKSWAELILAAGAATK